MALARPPAGQHWYVLERSGRVLRFRDLPDTGQLTEVIDLAAEVDPQGDGGLVALAFHPRFEENGQLFLSYTARGGTVNRSRVIAMSTRDGGATFSPATRRLVFDFDQDNPWRIHLNADMRFGPDGFLYVGFGDGSPMGDPLGRAQNPLDYRGKILRVDVDGGEPYRIPPDNPFVGREGALEEVYALGLRNPWRFSFDRKSGHLWAGDVGAYTWEEINRIPAGGNLGWSIREGSRCLGGTQCASVGLVSPVAEYGHDGQAASVVGGFVYHGSAIPSLAGRYLFADYVRGDVWALGVSDVPELIARTARRIVSFAEEPNGEPLVIDFSSGEILRLEPAAPASELVAERLSETGCFLASDPRRTAPGLVPYQVRVPFWSDGADKQRFLALPDGSRATIQPDGRIALPTGSVLVKQFLLAGRPVETRLMMKYRDGHWAGYSYAWDLDGREARLAPESAVLVRDWGGVAWSYPTRAQCLACHTQDRGLGLEVAQLDPAWPRGEAQVATSLSNLKERGLLEGAVPAVPRLPRVDGKAPLAQRARAYLHVNCAICHTRDGPTPVDMDLRFNTPLADTRLCGVAPTVGDLGVARAVRLAPGAPQRSVLVLRMRARGRDHMPPIGPQQTDDDGAALVEAWIRGMSQCP